MNNSNDKVNIYYKIINNIYKVNGSDNIPDIYVSYKYHMLTVFTCT